MTGVFILLECTVGYLLLKTKKCETIEKLSEILNDTNFETLKEKFELIDFKRFSSIQNATDNTLAMSTGKVTKDLKKMLKKHLTDQDAILVTMDKRLCDSLKTEALSPDLKFSAESGIKFKLRTLRFNVHQFIGYTKAQLEAAANGLATSSSRAAIQYNDNRSDSMIIQTISLIDHQDKLINKLAMKIREWFGYHFPELFKLVPDNKKYCQVIDLIDCRANVAKHKENLEEILLDSSKAQSIIEMAKVSVGYELKESDFVMIKDIVKDILANIELREQTAEYLSRKMAVVCPNFSTLVGDIVAARLIAHAGSLLNLAKSCPASTIQILGAEKALFRAIKNRSNTPKYGLLYHSHFISRAAKTDKGKISRFLASKIALAVRLDAFSEEPNNIFGEHLKREMEDQLIHNVTGNETMRNRDVMAKAYIECQKFIADKKARQAEETVDNTEIEKPKKKKKSKILIEEVQPKPEIIEETETQIPKKKKKSKIFIEEVQPKLEIVEESETLTPKKKKKKSKQLEDEPVPQPIDNGLVEVVTKNKKKKKHLIEESSTVNKDSSNSSKRRLSENQDSKLQPQLKKPKKEKN